MKEAVKNQLDNVYVYAWPSVCMVIQDSLVLFTDKYHINSAMDAGSPWPLAFHLKKNNVLTI